MEDVNIEDVRAEAAVAVASTLVDNVQRERRENASRVFKYPPPPPFIRAVLLIQAWVRRRAFLRSFGQMGDDNTVDEEILELAPPKPLMSLALNFVRRLKSFRWVNVEREATLVAGLVDAQAARITMRDVSAVVNYYQDKVPSDHLSLNVLQEALDRQVIVAKEALQERASQLHTPVAIVEAMEQVIDEFQVPPEREDRVLDQTRLRLKRIVTEAEEQLRKALAESTTTPAIDAVAARLRREFGPVASAVEEEIKVARLRRVQFLEMELETRWARPFVGPLPPHSAAARRYELELGKKNPKVIEFVAEETAHAATLEADLEVELSSLQKKVRELMKKRMEARARALIQDFDEKLADTFAQIQEVIEKAIVNIGPDNQKVKKRAQELLSPEAMMSLPLSSQDAQDAPAAAAETEAEAPSPEAEASQEPVPEASTSQRVVVPDEFDDIELEPPLPPPGEGPPPGPPLDTRPAEKQREVVQGGRAELDPDLDLDEDFWGEPAGFAELVSINDQVWDPKKLELQEEQARISFEPDPTSVMRLTTIAAEDDSPEMEQRRAEQAQAERERGEQKERTAVLTLEDLTMDTVQLHTEDVFKLKFIRSIADALQIPKHRVKVNGFAHGSVKVLLSILEPTGDEPDDEEGRSRISADRALEELFSQVEDPNSRLRLGEVGPFVASARLDRDVIPSAQVNARSMGDSYLASSLQGDDYELSDPWGESTTVRPAEDAVDHAETLAQTAQQSVGTRWGSARMEHGSLQADSQFRSTCPHSKEDGTLAAWAIPYEKQPMYTFYDKGSEEIAKETIVRLPEEKRKVTMTASFHLTRHPATGTDSLKGKVEPAGGVKVFSADTWLDKDHLGLKDPTIRPGDVDLQETMKKKAMSDPLAQNEEEESTPPPEEAASVRPTSAASAVSDVSSSGKKKRKGSKKKEKSEQESLELTGDEAVSVSAANEDSRETGESGKSGSFDENEAAESEAGRKTPSKGKKKGGRKKAGSANGTDEMGHTAESFASATSALTGATDESEAESPKAARKKKPEAAHKAKAKAKERRTSENPRVEAPSPVTGSAEAEEEVVLPGHGKDDTSPKSHRSGASPKRTGRDRTVSPKPQADRRKGPADSGKDLPENLDGLGGSFATQFCWAGMYGGMTGTGLRPRWKDNPRLPQLVGKPSTDDLHTPCFVRQAYRHGTVTVGPPYKLAEAMDETSPAWCAAKMLDASIERKDWARSYSKILKEHVPKLGPDTNIRVASRSFSLPKVATRMKPRERPPVRAASVDRPKETDGKKDRQPAQNTPGTQIADSMDTSVGKDAGKTPKTKNEEDDKKKKKDKKKKDKKKGKGDEGEGEEEGKKKKDKKKKEKKKGKGETGEQVEEEEVPVEEPVDQEEGEPPFELLPSVGTWMVPLFIEEEAEPVLPATELPQVVPEPTPEEEVPVQTPELVTHEEDGTQAARAAVATAIQQAAEDDNQEAVQSARTSEGTAPESSEDSAVIGAQAAIVHAIQQAAKAKSEVSAGEASDASAVLGAQAAIAHAIQMAAKALEERGVVDAAESQPQAPAAPSRRVPFGFLASVGSWLMPLPFMVPPSAGSKEQVPADEPAVVEEAPADEPVAVEEEPVEPPPPEPPRLPVKRTPFTNVGATRREVSNFASSLTQSIVRDAKQGRKGFRGASRSPSPLPGSVPAEQPAEQPAAARAEQAQGLPSEDSETPLPGSVPAEQPAAARAEQAQGLPPSVPKLSLPGSVPAEKSPAARAEQAYEAIEVSELSEEAQGLPSIVP